MRILFSREEIQSRVQEMGKAISADYRDRELTVVGALKGCFIFMADLVRHIEMPLTTDFIEVSSYGDDIKSTGIVRINKDFKHPVTGKHLLLVEDIIDTGLTLNFLMDNIALRRPASVKIASLLVKERKQQMHYPIDYRGFDIEDDFVVGYGMDYRGFLRNLDHIAVLDEQTRLSLLNDSVQGE